MEWYEPTGRSAEGGEDFPPTRTLAHLQDLWSEYVADPYAAHTDLVGVSANDLSCISVESSPRVLCVVSDSSLTVVGGSRRNKTYHRVTDDVKSCRCQMGVDWVYAKDL